MHPFNITDPLREYARQKPDQAAVVYANPGHADICLTFAELDARCDRVAAGLFRMGIGPGDRVLILAQPDEHFVPFVLGLIRAGGVVVMVDPGRPMDEFLNCIAETEPAVLLAAPVVHAAAYLFPRAFGKVTRRIVTAGRFPGAVGIDSLLAGPPEEFHPVTGLDSEAAIIFTTGSTGKPKGVVYTQRILLAQCQALQTMLRLSGSDTGLFGASAMLLLSLISGVTSIVSPVLNAPPQMVDVALYVHLLEKYQVTLSFSSPALCRRLVQWNSQAQGQLPHLRQWVVGGAPVDVGLVQAVQSMLPNGELMVSLGSTEAMPVAMIGAKAVLEKSSSSVLANAGACTGYPPPGHELRVIPIQDGPIPEWSDALRVAPGQVGEIIFRGPVVTGAYLHNPDLTALAKIKGDQSVWHRMGDVGVIDAQGCLWFYGRKSQRVETRRGVLFTVPCEAVFNRHPAVARSALVGLGPRGHPTPVMVIELAPEFRRLNRTARQNLAREILEFASADPLTQSIRHTAVFPGTFPVDIRHNSKINREWLTEWVKRRPTRIIECQNA
jgi:acyl-CoA synthetase (AMP-forming)/AMP-acid ligase II